MMHLRVCLARAMGWTDLEVHRPPSEIGANNAIIEYPAFLRGHAPGDENGLWRQPPMYLDDHNAIAAVRNKLLTTPALRTEFIRRLRIERAWTVHLAQKHVTVYDLVNSTPVDQANAIHAMVEAGLVWHGKTKKKPKKRRSASHR